VSNLLGAIEQTILTRRLIRPGRSILVAVSGGLDSMVLLEVLRRLAPANRWKLTVAHFNHQLRGRASAADEKWVSRIAEKWDLPLVVGRAPVRTFAARHGLSLEMAARQLRHQFLARSARNRGVQTIALAHHADDQVELFFLRLLRGAGGEGLAGMKWSSPSPGDPAITLIRPLLGCAKAELRRFADKQSLTFREDASNASLDFLRNRIRHQLLPLLVKQYQPALRRTTLRLMDILSAEAEFITRTAEAWFGKQRCPPFERLPVAIQRRCLQLGLFKLGLDVDFDLVERLRAAADQPVAVNPQTSVCRDAAGTVRLRPTAPIPFNPRRLTVDLTGESGTVVFGRLKISWEIQTRGQNLLPARARVPGTEYFDADKVGPSIVLRHWRRGDRYQPIGMAGSVKLQDLFCNQKVPRAERHRRVIAATTQGELVWVQGLRIAGLFKLDKGAVRRLKWDWQNTR